MSISIYELLFPDIDFNYGDNTQVCCPFPHSLPGGERYYETNPSAGVHLEKGIFHCFSCQRGHNEISFTAEYFNMSIKNATIFLELLKESKPIDSWEYAVNNLNNNLEPQKMLDQLGISLQVAKELKLGYTGNGISIPVIMFNRIFDIVTYRPNSTPKYIRKPNSMSGLIIPYDSFITNPAKKVLICAGEKDMMIARTNKFNAITFTGGELNKPELFLNYFIGKEVYILYDNDNAGREGAHQVAMVLKDYATSIYNVDLSVVCVNDKEDLWDFFMKYKRTKEDLIKLMESTKPYSKEDYVKIKHKQHPLVTLHEATQQKYLHKTVRSNVQIIATIDTTFSLPTFIIGKKTASDGDSDVIPVGTTKQWALSEKNYKDIFYLIDSNLKEEKIHQHMKTTILKFPTKEKNILIQTKEVVPVYKSIVTDLLNQMENTPMTEFVAYSLNKKLENGKKYLLTYTLIAHPQDGQKLMMVVNDVEEADDFLENFKITPEVKFSLLKFQKGDHTLKEKIDILINKVRGIVGANYDKKLLQIIDLWFHSQLQIKVGKEIMRGYLDALIVSETRVGKSTTVTALQETYGVGRIVSLAGTSTTIAGLIGGSNKTTGGSFQTRAGIIPQNHKGALIFEELAKCKDDILKELTEIRSSNMVRITRVAGNIELPAYVRMLSLTNPKTIGIPKPINQYPNGIAVLSNIVTNPEDIARYDVIAILGQASVSQIDPYYMPPTPMLKEDYRTRIRWAWSRKPEDIEINQTTYRYLIEKSNLLNKDYDSYIKIFGIESWKKILRLATAIATYVVSTDQTFTKVIVEKEHIDEAIEILVELYDNDVFKLKEFVKEERKYKVHTDEDVKRLQNIFRKSPIIIDMLETSQTITRSNLLSISGLETMDFNRILNELVALNFVKLITFEIAPTEKFFSVVKKIDKTKTIEEVTINV